MKEQLIALAVCQNNCFRHTRQMQLFAEIGYFNKTNVNNNNNYYYNSNKITIMRCRLKVFFGVFRSLGVFRSF